MRHLVLITIIALTLNAEDGGTEKNALYEKGKTLYFQNGCSNCHGSRGEGTGNYPLLANKPKGFLSYKLETFRKGVADSARQEMMIGFAAALTDAQIDAITTFLSDFHDAQTERYDTEYETWGDGGS